MVLLPSAVQGDKLQGRRHEEQGGGDQGHKEQGVEDAAPTGDNKGHRRSREEQLRRYRPDHANSPKLE